MPNDGEVEAWVAAFVLLRDAVGVVGGVVVVHEHLGEPQLRRIGDAVEHACQRRLCVVRHHQHADLHDSTPFGGKG